VLDGLGATRCIRASPGPAAAIPIVAMTANARREDRVACLDAGMDDYVSKPIEIDVLHGAIERARERAHRRDPEHVEARRRGATAAHPSALRRDTEPA
jgi:CheY-like chemotaxis protein